MIRLYVDLEPRLSKKETAMLPNFEKQESCSDLRLIRGDWQGL